MGIKGTGETVLALVAAITKDVTDSITKQGVPGPIAAESVVDAVAHGLAQAAAES